MLAILGLLGLAVAGTAFVGFPSGGDALEIDDSVGTSDTDEGTVDGTSLLDFDEAISNGDATNTASALGVSGTGTPSRLFGMLEDLKVHLHNGDKNAIRAVMTELQSIEDTVYQMMMKNGGRQTDLDWAEGILFQRDERLRANLSLEQDADVAAVAAELSRTEMSYQASLLVTSKLYQSNLMQYLR